MNEADKATCERIYADKSLRIGRIECCKCFHVGRKLICRKCGHHICMSCKEPGLRS